MATTQIDLCNRALRRLGTQSTISALTDVSTEAETCAAFYDDVLEALLENPNCSAYPNYSWQWPRRVTSGTSSGSTNPRWKYEYTLPSDCVGVSGLIRPDAPHHWWTQPERMFLRPVPYEIGSSMAGGSELVPVIWCDESSIDVLYVSAGMAIDNWPATFRRAFWLSLAAQMATTLGIDGNTTSAVMAEADRAIGQACQADQRVEVVSTDYTPDWVMVRDARFYGMHHEHRAQQSLASYPSGFIVGNADAAAPTPSYLVPSTGANGVSALGLKPDDIANRDNVYVSADTPDSRVGVLSIGMSPVGWRRPYHKTIENAHAADASGEYEV